MVLLIPHKGYIVARYYLFMKKVEIDNVDVMLKKKIDSFGRISGLKEWAGERAIVLIVGQSKNNK